MSDNKYQAPRGTQDQFGSIAKMFRTIEDVALRMSQNYGYQEIRTPLFEASPVFHRGLGESSDAVTKETYDFKDRGGDSLTLRPEGTASVVRAFLSNGMTHDLPLKFFYNGPMFRYERPQKGRLRQFHQFGVEALGYGDPWIDIESIYLGYQILNSLNLNSLFELEINTLGDLESRQNHRQAFVSYLTQHKEALSPESQVRLEKNPLRIFDSKSPDDQKILENAPPLQSFLTPTSLNFFNQVLEGLKQLQVPYKVSPRLVRGFDYYSHTVFEFTTPHLGSQSALLAGGRYNHLVSLMGGPETPCFGWAAGIERLQLLMSEKTKKPEPELSLLLLPLSDEEILYSLNLANQIRTHFDMKVDILSSGKIGKRIQKAEKKLYPWIGLVGDQEKNSQSLTLKNLKTGEQNTLPLFELLKMNTFPHPDPTKDGTH